MDIPKKSETEHEKSNSYSEMTASINFVCFLKLLPTRKSVRAEHHHCISLFATDNQFCTDLTHYHLAHTVLASVAVNKVSSYL